MYCLTTAQGAIDETNATIIAAILALTTSIIVAFFGCDAA